MAVAHVQTIQYTEQGGADGVMTTGSITVSANALLIVGLATFDAGSGNTSAASVTLNGVTPFTEDRTDVATADTDHGISIWSLAGASAGTHTVTVTMASGGAHFDTTIYVTEVSGALTSAGYLDGAGASATGSSTTPASGSMTGTATDFFYALALSESVTGTPASSWGTIPANGSMTTASHLRSAIAYLENPGSASQNGAFTGFTSAPWACAIVAYKVGAGGGGGGGNSLAWITA